MYRAARVSKVVSAMGRRRTWGLPGATPVPSPLPCRPSQVGGMGLPLGRSPLPCRPSQVGGMGLPLVRPRIAMLPQIGTGTGVPTIWSPRTLSRPPLSLPRRMYSDQPKSSEVYQELLKKKIQRFNELTEKAKLYLFDLLKASVNHTEKIALTIFCILKQLVKHSAKQVAAGFQAYVSQAYLYCFLLGVLAIAASLSKVLNLWWPSRAEGIDNWDARLKDLVKEFSETLPGACLEFAAIIVREIIISRKKLQVELLKRMEALNEKIEELEVEISVLKADRLKDEKVLDELKSQIEELRKAISKKSDPSSK